MVCVANGVKGTNMHKNVGKAHLLCGKLIVYQHPCHKGCLCHCCLRQASICCNYNA
jgi:hypothetical protein